MINITFIDASGTERTVQARSGDTLMRTAKDNGVPGIDADCGGCCACATCGVFVAPEWFDRVGPPGEVEASMLECCRAVGPHSRLSCQVVIGPAFEGLRVATPDSQQ